MWYHLCLALLEVAGGGCDLYVISTVPIFLIVDFTLVSYVFFIVTRGLDNRTKANVIAFFCVPAYLGYAYNLYLLRYADPFGYSVVLKHSGIDWFTVVLGSCGIIGMVFILYIRKNRRIDVTKNRT